MSSVDVLISQLRADGVRVWVEGETLRCSSASGAVDMDKLGELKKREEEIVFFLKLQDLLRAPIVPVQPRPEHIPVSIAQEAYWGMTLANCSNAVRLKGDLDVRVLERVLTEIARRHEVLRTNIVEHNGQLAQVIQPTRPIEAHYKDLSDLPDAKRLEDAAALSGAFEIKPFDLAKDLSVRLQVLRLAPKDHIVTVAIPHLMADATSLHIFWGETRVLYNAFGAGLPSPLPELPAQFADYALWERKQFPPDVLKQLRRYWENILQAPSTSRLSPADREKQSPEIRTLAALAAGPKTSIQSMDMQNDGRTKVHSFTVPTNSIRKMALKERTTPHVIVLAAFKSAISDLTGEEDVTISNTASLRTQRALSRMIGYLAKARHTRTKVGDKASFPERIKAVHESAAHAKSAHQVYYFEAANVLLNYIPFVVAGGDRSADDLWPDVEALAIRTMGRVNAHQRLILSIGENAEQVRCVVIYHEGNVSTELIERLGSTVHGLLETQDAAVR